VGALKHLTVPVGRHQVQLDAREVGSELEVPQDRQRVRLLARGAANTPAANPILARSSQGGQDIVTETVEYAAVPQLAPLTQICMKSGLND
jgi:hypothetical protein